MFQNIKQNLNLAGKQVRPNALLALINNVPYQLSSGLNQTFLAKTPAFNPNLPSFKLPQVKPSPLGGFSLGLVVLGVGGTLFFSAHLKTHYNLQPVGHAQAAARVVVKPAVKVPKTMPAAQPTEIDIPSVDIQAPIVPTGLNSQGGIAVPDTPAEAGWYDHSPTPGQLGPSIIVGHVDYLTGIAVFWRLREVQPGAEIDISRADGSIARFMVDAIQQYSKDNFPNSLIYGNIDHAGIRLITCSGTFDTATHHYTDNTVVFGTLE